MKPYIHPPIREITLPMVMQALSDPIRIEILRALMDAGELACGDIPLTISKATVSHHFAVLRDAGLILTRTEGTRCMNSVREEEIGARFPGLLDLVTAEKPKKSGRKAKLPG
ncbi:metalloregulator ArsR/SmtB family transcription factor [Luteolibacter flavescens]|uniref:Metalloregulator ArsR/SmtB family transcription factor n=1 Tax=Luteolibacter flavescens TaxID=1859460 RepID=A0ABT3FP44_9BACT|nr:metalloregulator ArsR/SmtB family transcription factor [Luteolibacter flavescens]MCW1884989.1 metalloregulator ArsR/SmtB family transcription factor [Luteolibacter flavescens]